MKTITKLTADQKLELDELINNFLYDLDAWSVQYVPSEIEDEDEVVKLISVQLAPAIDYVSKRIVDQFAEQV